MQVLPRMQFRKHRPILKASFGAFYERALSALFIGFSGSSIPKALGWKEKVLVAVCPANSRIEVCFLGSEERGGKKSWSSDVIFERRKRKWGMSRNFRLLTILFLLQFYRVPREDTYIFANFVRQICVTLPTYVSIT